MMPCMKVGKGFIVYHFQKVSIKSPNIFTAADMLHNFTCGSDSISVCTAKYSYFTAVTIIGHFYLL